MPRPDPTSGGAGPSRSPWQAAPQSSMIPQSTGNTVLAARLDKVRRLPPAQLPADGASRVRCEELQDELRALLANWRSWRCDASVKAVAVLLAAVDAAPVDMEVFLPLGERGQWDVRLLGPALVAPGHPTPRTRAFNHALHNEIWGTEYMRGPESREAEPSPDVLLKCITTGYYMSFMKRGGEPDFYESATHVYVLLGRCGVALNRPSVATAMAARLRELGSPLTVEALSHVIHHQKVFQACRMWRQPEESQHQALKHVVTTSLLRFMLPLRPDSPRTCCIAADALLDLGEPMMALSVAARGQVAEKEQGSKQPYHAARLHLLTAKALQFGGLQPQAPVDAMQAELEAFRRRKAECKPWLPTVLRNSLTAALESLPISEARLTEAVQAGRATLPAVAVPPPVALQLQALQAAGGSRRRQAQAAQAAQQVQPAAGPCNCPECRAKAKNNCWGCNNSVAELKRCSQCRVAAYCSRQCQAKHWREGHKEECKSLAAGRHH